MIEITVSHLTKTYGDNVVLDDLSLEVYTGEKVALVGANGAGKTTLARILTGEEPFDAGTVSLAAGRQVGVLSQLPVYPEGYTAKDVLRDAFAPLLALRRELESLEQALQTDHTKALMARYGQMSAEFERRGGFDMETPLHRVRTGLQISDAMCASPFDRLSGGERTRINLARLILTDADLLLLDEPTNHLDIKGVEWLEEYVSRYRGTVVLISHDRYFMDNAATRVIELSQGKAESYSGNYSFYVRARAQKMESQRLAYAREQRENTRLMDTARRMHDYAGKSAKLHKRAFAIEKRALRAVSVERPPSEKSLRARFESGGFRGAEALNLHDLSCGFGAPLFSGVSLTVRGGERIGILGENGTGKTTLLRALCDELTPLRGGIRHGPSVKAAYLPQQVTFDHPERTLLDTLLYEQNETTQNARDRLARFHFVGEDVFKRTDSLSGGEKSRFKLCMLMKDKVNLLLLDEPTNHLDIASREWMEEAVEDFKDTLLFVSHDRYFIARLATRLWILENGGVTDFKGTFEEYRTQMAARVPLAEAPAKESAPPRTPAKRGRAQRVNQARLRGLEAEIEQRENRLREVEQEMTQNAADAVLLQTLYEEKENLATELNGLYETWGELSEEMDEQEAKL